MDEEKKETLLNKLYERVLEDPILIPLTWRIWVMIAIAVWTFWNLVIVPVAFVIQRGTPKFCEMDGTFIGIGLIATSLCLLTAVRSIKRKNGKNWNKCFRKKS